MAVGHNINRSKFNHHGLLSGWWLLSGDAEFRIQDMVIHSQMRVPPRFLQQMFQKIAEFCLSESEYLFNEIKNLEVPLLYKTKQIWDKKTSFIDHQIMLQRKSEWRGAGDNPVSKHTSKTIENGNVPLKPEICRLFGSSHFPVSRTYNVCHTSKTVQKRKSSLKPHFSWWSHFPLSSKPFEHLTFRHYVSTHPWDQLLQFFGCLGISKPLKK